MGGTVFIMQYVCKLNDSHFVPQNVILVLSCQSDTRCHQRLCHHDNTVHLKVGQLDRLEKSDVAREMLAVHRKKLDESPFNNQVTTAFEDILPLCQFTFYLLVQ